MLIFWKYRSATPVQDAGSAKIVDARTGGRPSFGQFLIRFFAYLVSTVPLGLGFVWIAFDPRKQRWHDKLPERSWCVRGESARLLSSEDEYR